MKVGIDLGTTYSLIARMDANSGVPRLIADHGAPDEFHTPSVVLIGSHGAFVGRVADLLLEENPDLQAIRFFKRQLGEDAPLLFDAQQRPWFAEALAALLLRKLRFDAETAGHVDSAVITVPAHFNDRQRKAVIAAAALADLPVLGLVEEPVAAALHYGVQQASHDQILLVYDWGGGTFDATVLSMDARGVYVLAKHGVTELGGKELDDRIAAIILSQFERALGAPLPLKAATLLALRRTSEQIKIELCNPNGTNVRRTVLLGGEAVDVEISRAAFETAIADLVERTEAATLECVADAGLQRADVHKLLLVGGSSMTPLVSARLTSLFGAPHQRVLYHEPGKAVAYGAALHAAQLTGEAQQYNMPPELRGVTGYAVGVRTVNLQTGRPTIDTLIKQNMPLPIRVKKTYFTTRANQDLMVLDLVQFRERDGETISLGTLTVGPLPSPRLNYPIEVTVENREDGTVAVQAFDADTGVELQQVFGRDTGGGFTHLAAQRAIVRSIPINR